MWKATITPANDFYHGNAVASLLLAKDHNLLDKPKILSGAIWNLSRKINPIEYLFAMMIGIRYYAESISKILHRTAHKTGIKKYVTPKPLHPGFAKHFLMQGVNLKYLQELLVRESSRKMEFYTNVSNEELEIIINPFNDFG